MLEDFESVSLTPQRHSHKGIQTSRAHSTWTSLLGLNPTAGHNPPINRHGGGHGKRIRAANDESSEGLALISDRALRVHAHRDTQREQDTGRPDGETG